MEQKYVKEIIEALKSAHEDFEKQNFTHETKLMTEMTISDFAKEIEVA